MFISAVVKALTCMLKKFGVKPYNVINLRKKTINVFFWGGFYRAFNALMLTTHNIYIIYMYIHYIN